MDVVEAGLRRRVWIWYLDLLVIASPLAAVFTWLEIPFSGLIVLALFGAIEVALWRNGLSPAAWIVHTRTEEGRTVVDAAHAGRERWIPMISATVTFWAGSNAIKACTTGMAGPILGYELAPVAYGVYRLVFGAIDLVIGAAILRGSPIGLFLLAAVLLWGTADMLLAVPVMEDVIRATFEERGEALPMDIGVLVWFSNGFVVLIMAVQALALLYLPHFLKTRPD